MFVHHCYVVKVFNGKNTLCLTLAYFSKDFNGFPPFPECQLNVFLRDLSCVLCVSGYALSISKFGSKYFFRVICDSNHFRSN